MRFPLSVSIVLAVIVGVIGCGGDDNSGDGGAARTPATTAEPAPSPEPAQSLKFVADANRRNRWTRTTYRTKAGKVELRLANPSSDPHNVAIEKSRKCCEQPGATWVATSPTALKGEKAKVVADLKPGRYWAFCNVASHWQGGMVSRLVVE